MWLACSMSRDNLTIREASSIRNKSWMPRAMQMSESLVEPARDEALMERPRRNLVVHREPSFFSFLGRVDDSTCLHVDCSHELWATHHGVVLLSGLLRFHSSVRLLCR